MPQLQLNHLLKLLNLPTKNLTKLLAIEVSPLCLKFFVLQENCFDDLMDGSITVDSLQDSKVLQDIDQMLMEGKDTMQNKCTAKLWLQYLRMVNILQAFIKAEWTGNWQMHLKAMYDMLPYIAAAGHNNYTRSVYLYLQNMEGLQEQHPEVYQHFQNGLHVVRRSDRYWAGLSPDLVIEQVLMRSIKTTGGLSLRGRGMTETQCLVWLLSTIACSEVNLVMQELMSVNFLTSEQHKDVSETRQQKDMRDTQELLNFLMPRNPFHEEPSKHGLDCSTGCGQCRGVCTNLTSLDDE